MEQHRRSRSQTLPSQQKRFSGMSGSLSPADEADDEMSNPSQASPALRGTSPMPISNNQLRQSPSSSSLVGSLYALGGAVWNIIRGPVDTDSADDLVMNRRSSSPASSEASSEAPDFEISPQPTIVAAEKQHFYSHPNSSADAIRTSDGQKRSIAEPGRDKVTLIAAQSKTKCTLFGRNFPVSEHILLQSDIESLQTLLPTRWNLFCNWHLLYSTRGNGFSLSTLYCQLKQFKGPILFAVKDDNDDTFGAFANQPFICRQGHYGNGETFLWKIDRPTGLLHKYPSTGKNNYFLLSEPDYVAVGCGGGKFGLWLDAELLNGNSAPVPTFDNEQLSFNREFQCQGVEVWGLDLEQF